ncbi:hypothetical protein J6590_001672 [Homalodisca vitripennis]|nr:hypothetical protein J6590_001672 [Homalodisca vitripennis]
MRSLLTLLSAFGSAACAREYRSDNARCCGVRRRLMTLMGQNAQEFGFVALMPFLDISTHKVFLILGSLTEKVDHKFCLSLP